MTLAGEERAVRVGVGMLAITWYSFFRLLHVASAVFFMGTHFVLPLMVKHISKNPESAPTIFPLLDKAGRFRAIGGPLMLVTGLLMIAFSNSGWSAFRELWLLGSLAILVFIAIWLGVKVRPTDKAMAAAIQRGPIDPEEWKVLSGRMNAALNVEGVALVLVVILMVLRPTL